MWNSVINSIARKLSKNLSLLSSWGTKIVGHLSITLHELSQSFLSKDGKIYI